MSPELDPLYVLDELGQGNDLDCPNCLTNINIVGPNMPHSGEPFSFTCPYCDNSILELTGDGSAVYNSLKGTNRQEEVEKLDDVVDNLDNLMSDDEVEEVIEKLLDVKNNIS